MAAAHFQDSKVRRLKYSKFLADNKRRSITLNVRQVSRGRHRRYVPNIFSVKKRQILCKRFEDSTGVHAEQFVGRHNQALPVIVTPVFD